MDEVTALTQTKKVGRQPIASLEGTKCAEEIQVTGELRELQMVQSEITHALSLMNEIREKLEVAYRELAPQD